MLTSATLAGVKHLWLTEAHLSAQGCWEKQVSNLVDLIDIINSELTKNDRKKLITLCTIDVHARDVVQRLIDERVENVSCFQWQSQLRYYQNEKTKEAQVTTTPSALCLHLNHM